MRDGAGDQDRDGGEVGGVTGPRYRTFPITNTTLRTHTKARRQSRLRVFFTFKIQRALPPERRHEMTAQLTKVLEALAKLRGTIVEHEVSRHKVGVIEYRLTMRAPPALTEEERVARTNACKRRALVKAKAKWAEKRALLPVPTAEELASKCAARKAARKVSCRRHRIAAGDALRTERARLKRVGARSRT